MNSVARASLTTTHRSDNAASTPVPTAVPTSAVPTPAAPTPAVPATATSEARAPDPRAQNDTRRNQAQREGQLAASVAQRAAPTTPAPSLADVRGGRAELHPGMRGDAVKELQRLVGVQQTGLYGPTTLAAVQKFQAERGLSPATTGAVGRTTLAALEQPRSQNGATAATTGAASADATADGLPTSLRDVKTPALDAAARSGVLGRGQSGPAVRELQTLLGFGAGGQTGVYGPTTEAAVKAFQRAHNIVDNGQVGGTTLAALHRAATNETGGGMTVSADGRRQMAALLQTARTASEGRSPDGRCYTHVANFLDRTGFGKVARDGFNAAVPAAYWPEARNFAEYANQPGKLEQLGLQRLDTALTPPIRSPYDPRIPAGAVVVVPAVQDGVRTPGTAHATAGDIAVADGKGRFFNGGEMSYGPPASFPPGNLLGIYVPR